MKLEKQLEEAEASLEWLGIQVIKYMNSPSFQRYYSFMIQQEVIVDDLREEVKDILNSDK